MDYTLSNSYSTDPATGRRLHDAEKAVPTVWNDADANMLIWSLMEVVGAAGLAGVPFDKATPASYQVLLRAIRRLSGGNVRTLTAGVTVLTVEDAGLVLINATAGAVTVTLPSSAAMRGARFSLRRIDGTGNAVTISRAGADVVDESLTTFALSGRGDHRVLVADGVSGWSTVAAQGSQTWQSLTGARAISTTYTNSTGRPIVVNALATFNAAVQANAYLIVSGVSVIGSGNNWAGSPASSVLAIVPAGGSYRLEVTGGHTGVLSDWAELR